MFNFEIQFVLGSPSPIFERINVILDRLGLNALADGVLFKQFRLMDALHKDKFEWHSVSNNR